MYCSGQIIIFFSPSFKFDACGGERVMMSAFVCLDAFSFRSPFVQVGFYNTWDSVTRLLADIEHVL